MIILIILLVLVVVILVGYDIFSVETQKIAIRRQMEENARIEREMLEELKTKETRELAEYYRKYRPIKAGFIEKTAELSEKMEDKIINTVELEEFTTQRLDASRNYKEKLIEIGNVPEPLKTFFSYELEFLESDIKTVNLVLSYYDSESYSDFNDNAIEKLYENTESLLLKAEEELQRVYSQSELKYLLEESSYLQIS